MSHLLWRVLDIVCILLYAVIFGICIWGMDACPLLETATGSVPMKCHWAFIAVGWMCAIGAVSAFIALFNGNTLAKRQFSILQVLIAICCILMLTPLGIGICAHEDSGCHMPAYVTWCVCAIVIIISIIMVAKANADAQSMPKKSVEAAAPVPAASGLHSENVDAATKESDSVPVAMTETVVVDDPVTDAAVEVAGEDASDSAAGDAPALEEPAKKAPTIRQVD